MNRDMNPSQIQNRAAIITGGGRGLGRAMVLGLARSGIHVVADVTQDDDCAKVVDTAVTRFGRLDILVNNAARGMRFSLWSFESGARIGDDHLGAGSRGDGCDSECAAAWRTDAHRHGPGDDVGRGEISDARPIDHRPTVAVARVAGSRWDDRASCGGDQMADQSRRPIGCGSGDRTSGW